MQLFQVAVERNFTLIELLVVVAITAILADAVPALCAAKARAVSISCTSRLKQIGTADSFYQSDYGYFCPITDKMSATVTWFGTGKLSSGYDFTGDGYLNGYLKKASDGEKMMAQRRTNVLFCPDASIEKLLTKKGEMSPRLPAAAMEPILDCTVGWDSCKSVTERRKLTATA